MLNIKFGIEHNLQKDIYIKLEENYKTIMQLQLEKIIIFKVHRILYLVIKIIFKAIKIGYSLQIMQEKLMVVYYWLNGKYNST